MTATTRKVQADQLDLVSANAEAFTTGGLNDLVGADKLVIADVSDSGIGKVATLDQVKDLVLTSVTGAMVYKGLYDASGNVAPSPGGLTQGWYYIISVAGTFGGETYAVKDWTIYNGTSWDKIDTASDSEVLGPGSATDEALARFDGTTGKLVQNSVVLVSDTGKVSGVDSLVINNDTAGPGTPSNGEMYFDSTYNTLMYYDNTRTKWLSIDNHCLTFSKDSTVNAGIALQNAGGVDTSSTPALLPADMTLVSISVRVFALTTNTWDLEIRDTSGGGSGNFITHTVDTIAGYSSYNVAINQNFNAGDALRVRVDAVTAPDTFVNRPVVTLVFKRRK